MYELIVINLALALSFSFVTFLVLRKSRNISSLAFSWTTFLFALSTFFGTIEESYNAHVLTGTTPQIMTVVDNIIFPLAPLGLLFSSFVIKRGYDAWKNFTLWVFTVIYVLVEVVLFALRFIQDFSIINEIMNNAVWNALVTIPLLLSIAYFFSIYQEMDDERNKMLFVVLGVTIGTLGQFLNVFGIIMVNESLVLLSFVVIVVGVLFVSLSFMNITSVQRDTASQPTIN